MYSDTPLIKKWKSRVIPGRKTTDELIAYLSARYDMEKIPYETAFTPFHRQIIEARLENTDSPHEFLAFRFPDTPKNASIDRSRRFLAGPEVLAVFECSAGLAECTHYMLGHEIHLAQGVSQEDYDGDTERLLDYCASMEMFFEPLE